MATSATAPSRLNVTIPGYDQVIALSQANINETLDYYFQCDDALRKFDVKLQSPLKDAMNATLNAPTIELIDVDKADQALYFLNFENGWFSYKTFSPKRVQISMKGWKLAFNVSFAMEKMAAKDVPDIVRKEIEMPGSYDVDQLIVTFGSAHALSFNWNESTVGGFDALDDEKEEGEDEDGDPILSPREYAQRRAKDTVQTMVDTWLRELKEGQETESRNVLGYTVKFEPTAVGNLPLPPSFPPTSVRLQTVNYRPDGDQGKSSTKHDLNAFMFTEMTEGRPMSPIDLDWSGDFFYDSFGGAMVMSRRIFLEKYVAEKLLVANDESVKGANVLARCASTDILRDGFPWIISDSPKHFPKWMNNGDELTYRWDESRQLQKDWEIDNFPDPTQLYDITTNVCNLLKPIKGDSRLLLRCETRVCGKITWKAWGVHEALASLNCTTRAYARTDYSISLSSVGDRGDLNIKVKADATEKDCDVTFDLDQVHLNLLRKIDVIDRFIKEWIQTLPGVEDVRRALVEEIDRQTRNVSDLQEKLQDALNHQASFVFPGAGTFSMKDPIFSNAGDLMMALSYKKRPIVKVPRPPKVQKKVEQGKTA